MHWLNYHHLLYFRTVAREGTILRAAEKLHIGQPAISTQLGSLEESLEVLLSELILHNVDIVLSDTPIKATIASVEKKSIIA